MPSLLRQNVSGTRAATDPNLLIQPGGLPGAEMSTYNPSWTEMLGAKTQDMLEGFGVSRPMARDYGGKAETAASLTPGVGQVLSANDYYRSANAGDLKGMGWATLGMLPGAKGAKLLDEGADAMRGVTKLASDFDPMSIAGKKPNLLQQVDGTVGDLNNPSVMFEGVSPHDFTPDQWGRFGEAYGVPNLGPKSADDWTASLRPYKTTSGVDFTVPGGLETKDPMTYYDLLHMKQQGINPNDMPPAMHQALHDRMVATMSPAGEVSPERLFNQMSLAQISPNQPLTPNELAVARVMAKGPEDIKRMGGMVPWRYNDPDAVKQAKEVVGTKMVTNEKTNVTKEKNITARAALNDKIANQLGLGAGSAGGLGARGTADYSRLAETAQRLEDNPDFFRFRGGGEGGATNAEDWANFVERLSNQTPGLSSKTGSFGAVWQNPAEADISAVDRHMAGLFTKEMFPSSGEYDEFAKNAIDRFNIENKGSVGSFNDLPAAYKNDVMFGYLNNNPGMKYRVKKTGEVNPNVPEHLRPENAGWVHEPSDIELISPPYKRVLQANADRANEAGQSTFSNQWMLWDRIRNRVEPHEIMFPGLEKLPRMSMEQMHQARADLAAAGYMSSAKGDEGLSSVRKLPSASRAAYFALPPLAAIPAYNLLQQPEQRRPDEEVM